MQTLINSLKSIDEQLFLFLNGLNHPWLDMPFYYISQQNFWIPVYLLFLFFAFKEFGFKGLLWIVALVALVITLSDQTSVKLFKNVFERYRPCHNETFGHLVHTVKNHCGGKFGFISSHATNYFAVAAFITGIHKSISTSTKVFIFLWAVLIAYSRIYLGVHYPADVTVGALWGVSIGYAVVFLAKKLNPALFK
ncbi:MAG: phosphatase PAP2 family protein [Luteibaculaceae bacterium]